MANSTLNKIVSQLPEYTEDEIALLHTMRCNLRGYPKQTDRQFKQWLCDETLEYETLYESRSFRRKLLKKVVTVLSLPLDDMPLYISSMEGVYAEWRLRIGK